jgi:hypothetical protein
LPRGASALCARHDAMMIVMVALYTHEKQKRAAEKSALVHRLKINSYKRGSLALHA